MASGSESAVEKVGPRWALGPTEDVVQALMETLLDPLLPLRIISISPSEDRQIDVAKQMHAVVLLYNYHHRKQKPELVFLEFVDFCKLAIVIRPPLIAFMNLMKGWKLQELNETKDLLSVTEKAIKDACYISLGLDASRDVPNMEGWPISKVAVLLIDSKKENCMLQFGATDGAWSLLEKELDESSITPKMSVGNKVGNKRKRDDLKVSTCNTEFLQLGYDVVKDVTGFNFSDLEVLETYMTYSLSKQKSATCFYIMQYFGLFDEHKQVSLKFLVESVQGPLAEKFANSLWKSTALVKLHQMLPYMELIMCWFSGCEPEVKSSERKASPVDIFRSTEEDADFTNKFIKRFETLDHAQSSQNRFHENLEYDECLSPSPTRVVSEMVMKEDDIMEFEKGCDMADHDAGHSTEKDERRISPEILHEDIVECGKDVLSGPPLVLETTNRSVLTNICTGTEDDKLANTNIKIYHHRRNQSSSLKNVTPLQEAVQCPEVDMVDALDSNIEAEKVYRDKDCLTYMCNQTDIASDEDLRAQLQAETEHNVEPEHNKRRRDEKESRDEGYLTNMCNQAGTASTQNQQVQLEAVIEHDLEEESTLNSLRPGHNQSRDEKLSGDEGDHSQKCNHTGIAATGNQLAQVEAETKDSVEEQSTFNSLRSAHFQSIDEKLSGDEGDLANTCNQAGPASTENQQVQLEAVIQPDVEERSALDSLRPDHNQSGDKKLSGDGGDYTKCNHTGTAAAGNQLAQVKDGINQNVDVESTLNSLMSDHIQSRDEKLSGGRGDQIQEGNHSCIAATGNQQSQVEAEMKPSTSNSITPYYIQSRDKKLSLEKGDHTYKCNHTSIAAAGNQLPRAESKSKHDIGANTISASDQQQNALALLYRKRQELYSQICNMEDTLASCEDNVARIRDGGEVVLARQCIKSILSGEFHSLLEKGTPVQNKGNKQDANDKSQHGKPTKSSEVYITGKSSCQDLEYACLKNNWRLPRYLTESSNGKFLSSVVVEGKECKLHVKGGIESSPYKARETAAAQMMTLMRTTFL